MRIEPHNFPAQSRPVRSPQSPCLKPERDPSEAAAHSPKRIDVLFDIEREVNGRSAEDRLAVRQARSISVLANLEDWGRSERACRSRHASVTKAMDYMLTRRHCFARFTADDMVCLANNDAKRAIRGLALGSKS